MQKNCELIEALEFLLLTIVFGLWAYWLWSRRYLYRFAFQVPGVLSLPFLGINGLRIRSAKNLYKAFETIFKECKSHTVLIWIGLKPVLLTSDLVTIEKILSDKGLLYKASFYRPFLNILGGTLIADPPEIWRHKRKIVLPAFSLKALVSFFAIFHKAALVGVTKFDSIVGKGEYQIREILRRLGLGISLETVMGYVLKEGDNYDEDMVKNISKVVDDSTFAFILSFFHLDRLYRYYYPYDRAITKTAGFLEKLIEDKIKSRIDMIDFNTEDDDYEQHSQFVIKKSSTTFLDIAIDSYEENKFKWNDILCEAGTLIIGSFESGTSVLHGAIVMLAMHPECQERLFQEIYEFYPEKDFEMKHKDIENLPYLSMVINETMRLMPPLPLFGRHVDNDFQLTENLLLPKGLDVMIDIFHLHRNTDIWGPNAEKFYPDNFLPENMKDKHAYAFLPFSKGPRICIGYRYAYHAISVLLSGLVRNFRFTTSYKYEDLWYYEDIVIKFIEEPGIEVHRREL